MPVEAIVNPLRGVASDAAYVASVINQIPGPVLAVGHSYGGMIITNAVPQTTNVVGLVYVAAFAPDEGETLAGIVGRSKDSVLDGPARVAIPDPEAAETATELIIDPQASVRSSPPICPSAIERLALPASDRRRRARRADGPPAWKNLPTWAAVGTGDYAAGSDVVRSMAQRANATITEIEGSHVIMISQPDAVTDVIRQAIDGVTR